MAHSGHGNTPLDHASLSPRSLASLSTKGRRRDCDLIPVHWLLCYLHFLRSLGRNLEQLLEAAKRSRLLVPFLASDGWSL